MRTRNGKIARLPEPTRERINRMLDDGVRYRDIINALGQPGAMPLPYPISEMNLSNWRKGGHQAWLRRQEQLDLDRRFPLSNPEKAASIRSLLQQLKTLTSSASVKPNPERRIASLESTNTGQPAPPRSADFQSAVSPICNRQPNEITVAPKFDLGGAAAPEPNKVGLVAPDSNEIGTVAPNTGGLAAPKSDEGGSPASTLKTQNSKLLPNPSEPNRTQKKYFSRPFWPVKSVKKW